MKRLNGDKPAQMAIPLQKKPGFLSSWSLQRGVWTVSDRKHIEGEIP